jgi:AraC-like DNA-binding protein
MPDGCADVIAGVTGSAEPLVVGPMRSARVVPLSGPVDLFGVRFRPGCALPFLDAPLVELTDGRVPLDALWGRAAEAVADALAGGKPETRALRVERVLQSRLRCAKALRRGGDEALAVRAVDLMRRTRGSLGVADLAAALSVGERRLQRAFGRSVGLSPRALGRVLRFRRALREIERAAYDPGRLGWAALALGVGYADQPHFIREFKSLSGLTPARYVAERRAVGFIQYEEGGPE